MTAACVVPLAGPDLIHPRLGPRPLYQTGGQTLLARALTTRAWASALAPRDYTFVLRRDEGVDAIEAYLRDAWPGCSVVMLDRLTQGALLSAAAGAATLASAAAPLIVDLADIVFASGATEAALRDWPNSKGAVLPVFRSRDPDYSYVRIVDGRVVETAEKRVISQHASAGVYIFRDAAVFFAAISHSLLHRDSLAHAGALFLCPSMNGVLAQGLAVEATRVEQVESFSKIFKA